MQGAVAANYQLTLLKRKLLPDAVTLLSIEFNLSAFICVKRDILNLTIAGVVADADAGDLLVGGDLEAALQLLVLAHRPQLLSRDPSLGRLVAEVQLYRAYAVIDSTSDAAKHAL